MAGTLEVYPKWHRKHPYLMGLKTFVASNRTDLSTGPSQKTKQPKMKLEKSSEAFGRQQFQEIFLCEFRFHGSLRNTPLEKVPR